MGWDENDFVERKKNGNAREGLGDDKKKMTEDRKSMVDEIYQSSWSKVKRIWSFTTRSCASLSQREQERRSKCREKMRGNIRKKEPQRQRNKDMGQDRQTTFYEWSHCVFIKYNIQLKAWADHKSKYCNHHCYFMSTSVDKRFADAGKKCVWYKMWKFIFLQSCFFPR